VTLVRHEGKTQWRAQQIPGYDGDGDGDADGEAGGDCDGDLVMLVVLASLVMLVI
jgi:hypothetical protein